MRALWLTVLAVLPTPQHPLPSGASASAQVGQRPSRPFEPIRVAQARGIARTRDRQLLLAFYAPECPPCDQLDEHTFTDERVLEWLDARVVAVRVEDDDAEVARWRPHERPTLVFTNVDGEEFGRIAGFLEPDDFLRRAAEILSVDDGLQAAERALERNPEDPWPHLLRAKALRNRGRGEEAAAEYLWVFDRTRGDPAWRHHREEEALRNLGLLARKLPAARTAILERRDEAAATLLGQGEDEAPLAERLVCARELRLINLQLREQRDTLELWDTLRAREQVSHEVLAELFAGEDLVVLLLRDKRYEDLLDGLPDVVVLVERQLAEVHRLEALAQTDPDVFDQYKLAAGRLVRMVGPYYEAMLGAGREKDADDLAALVTAVNPGARSTTMLMEAAKRAGRMDVARRLLEQGLGALEDPEERQRLELWGERILGRGR